jgi:linearmycin/streptolysin S transport system permease protein
MRAALVIARRILRQRIRDRSAIVFAVVTPFALAVGFASIVPDFTGSFHATFAVVDADHGEVANLLTEQVLQPLSGDGGILDLETLPDVDAARQAIADGTVDAAIAIPAGFTEAVQSAQPASLDIIAGEGTLSLDVARAVVTDFANAIGTVQLMVATVNATGGTVDTATVTAAREAVQAPGPVTVHDVVADHLQASIATFYAASMAIMFVFFATQYGALALLAERQEGTLSRLLAAPIPSSSILLGGALASMMLGLISMGVLALATTQITNASWGPPGPVAALIVAAVVAAAGISLLLAGFARTAEGAGSVNAIVALILSAIGGVYIPLAQAPELLSRVALITPHAWFMRAIESLSRPGAGIADILPSIGVLLAMGAVTGAIGLARSRRVLVTA